MNVRMHQFVCVAASLYPPAQDLLPDTSRLQHNLQYQLSTLLTLSASVNQVSKREILGYIVQCQVRIYFMCGISCHEYVEDSLCP